MDTQKIFGLIKKVFYSGVGTAAIAGEKVKETVEELVKNGDLTELQGKELIDGYIAKLQEERDHLTKMVQEQVDKQIEKLNLVKATAHDALVQEVATLKKKIHDMTAEK